MNNRKLNEAFNYIDNKFLDQAEEMPKPVRTSAPAKRLLALAAVIILMLSLGITAYATGLLGLMDMGINKKPAPATDYSATSTAVQELFLGGYRGSDIYAAYEEWRAYKLENRENNRPDLDTPEDGCYPRYGAYSPEAKAALNEIAAKHGLKIHASEAIAGNPEELYEQTDSAPFLPPVGARPENMPHSGCILDGIAINSYIDTALLPNGKSANYDLYLFPKGYLPPYAIVNYDPSSYEEWRYTTAGGTELVLGLGTDRSIITADMEHGFAAVHIRSGTENLAGRDGTGPDTLTKEDVETLAELFDFTVMNRIAGKRS